MRLSYEGAAEKNKMSTIPQIENEPLSAYNSFLAWFELGGFASDQEVSNKINDRYGMFVNPSKISFWRREYRWDDRASVINHQAMKRVEDTLDKSVEEMKRNRLEMIDKSVEKLSEMVAQFNPQEIEQSLIDTEKKTKLYMDAIKTLPLMFKEMRTETGEDAGASEGAAINISVVVETMGEKMGLSGEQMDQLRAAMLRKLDALEGESPGVEMERSVTVSDENIIEGDYFER